MGKEGSLRVIVFVLLSAVGEKSKKFFKSAAIGDFAAIIRAENKKKKTKTRSVPPGLRPTVVRRGHYRRFLSE